MTLKVAPCSYEAAKYAVGNWHYSKQMPRHTRNACYGVWEGAGFVGCVVFGYGASPNLGTAYGLVVGQVIELTRVALRAHTAPVSQIISHAIVAVSRSNPGTRLVVSFADPARGHHGGIYQAGNWIYAGMTNPTKEYVVNGRCYHTRALYDTRWAHPRGRMGNSTNLLDWVRVNLDPNATCRSTSRPDGRSRSSPSLTLVRSRSRQRLAPVPPVRAGCNSRRPLQPDPRPDGGRR